MKWVCQEYKFETISIVLGVLGAVKKQLTASLKRLNFKDHHKEATEGISTWINENC